MSEFAYTLAKEFKYLIVRELTDKNFLAKAFIDLSRAAVGEAGSALNNNLLYILT